MKTEFIKTELQDAYIIQPKRVGDSRGRFTEVIRCNDYAEQLQVEFVQDNMSVSQKNVVRGMHFQLEHPQAKLVFAIQGRILDTIIDIRRGSPTYGKYLSVELTPENGKQLFVPAGFAHGFSVLQDDTIVYYKCSDYYCQDDEYGFAYSSREFNIDWQVDAPILSEKDSNAPDFSDFPQDKLPQYSA